MVVLGIRLVNIYKALRIISVQQMLVIVTMLLTPHDHTTHREFNSVWNRLYRHRNKRTMHLTNVCASVAFCLFLTDLSFLLILHSSLRLKKKTMFCHLGNWYHIIAAIETSLRAHMPIKANTSVSWKKIVFCRPGASFL